jgi:hypothetical protein
MASERCQIFGDIGDAGPPLHPAPAEFQKRVITGPGMHGNHRSINV